MSKFTVMYKSTNSMYLNVEADSLELDKMEEYCMQETGKTLQELWDSYEVE